MDHFWLQPQPSKVWPNQHAMKGWKKHNHKFNHKLFCKFLFEHVVPKDWGTLARLWDHSLQQLLGTPGNRTAQLGLACLVFWRIWEVKPSWLASCTSLCTRVRRHCKVLYVDLQHFTRHWSLYEKILWWEGCTWTAYLRGWPRAFALWKSETERE